MIVTDAYNPFLSRMLHRAGSFKRFADQNMIVSLSDGISLMHLNNSNDLRKACKTIKGNRNSGAPCVWGLSFSADLKLKDFKVAISFEIRNQSVILILF